MSGQRRDTDRAASRRRFLRIGGAGAAAAAVSVVHGANPADAAAGDTVKVDQAHTGAGTTSLTNSQIKSTINDNTAKAGVYGENVAVATQVIETVIGGSTTTPGTTVTFVIPGHPPSGNGVEGRGIVGIYGVSTVDATGAGVRGDAPPNGGVGVQGTAGATGAPLQIVNSADPASIPPATGTWAAGTFLVKAGHVWYCYAAGVGAASKWTRLSSNLVMLPTPVRAFDSRSGRGRKVTPASARRVSLVASGVPAGATAAALSLTALGAGATGFLTVLPAGAPASATRNLSWKGAGQTTTSAALTGVDAFARIDLRTTVDTHVLVDVVGWYT